MHITEEKVMNRNIEYDLDDIVEMKKPHPCQLSKYWQITRMGADIKVKCVGCGAVIMFSRHEFDKRIKKVIEHHQTEEE